MKFRMLALLLLFAASCVGVYFVGTKTASDFGDNYFGRTAEVPAPEVPTDAVIDGLAIRVAALDLGEVWEQADYPYDLAIHNRNAVPTEIFEVSVSCSCVEKVEPRTLTVAPGATAMVRLTLNLAKRNYGERALAKRPFAVAIHPVVKEKSQQPAAWNVHGVIKSRVTLDTAFLDFGDAMVSGQTSPSRKVTATVHIPNATLQATGLPEYIVGVKIRPITGSADTFDLIVSPEPGLIVGPFACKIQLDLLAADGARLPGVVLPVAGKVQPEVRAIPALLAFGPRRLDESAEATVTLQVPPGADWVVDHIETDSADVRVDPVADAGTPTGRVYRIRQSVTQAGHQASTVRFFVRKGKAAPVPVTMEVAYDGDAAGVVSEAKAKGAER